MDHLERLFTISDPTNLIHPETPLAASLHLHDGAFRLAVDTDRLDGCEHRQTKQDDGKNPPLPNTYRVENERSRDTESHCEETR